MCPVPDHGRVIAMDRPDDVGVPALEATLCQWPQGAKVNHFMTRRIRVCQHAREALVAGLEFVKLIARDGDEAPPWTEDSLTRTWTREDEDMESASAVEGRNFIRHGAEIEDVEIIGASDHVVVAKFQHDLWRRSAPPLFPQLRGQVIPVPLRAALPVSPRAAGPCHSVDGK